MLTGYLAIFEEQQYTKVVQAGSQISPGIIKKEYFQQ